MFYELFLKMEKSALGKILFAVVTFVVFCIICAMVNSLQLFGEPACPEDYGIDGLIVASFSVMSAIVSGVTGKKSIALLLIALNVIFLLTITNLSVFLVYTGYVVFVFVYMENNSKVRDWFKGFADGE